MTQPVISVIIAAFNQEKYLSRCLRSLLAQTISRDKFEIVVINDGSTDRSASVLGEFAGEIVLIDNEKNIGQSLIQTGRYGLVHLYDHW